MRRYRSPYIGKCHVPDLALAQTVDQHRNPLAGVIRPDPGRIIAMIGGLRVFLRKQSKQSYLKAFASTHA